MARFAIQRDVNGSAQTLFVCAPTYHATYLQNAYLEVSSLPKDVYTKLEVGDYITWRDGMKYALYNLADLTQNTNKPIGDSLEYTNVQFFNPCKQLEIALWRDLVESDNRIHYSTQKDISTFEALDGIVRRVQACLDDMYPGQWSVVVADGLSALMPEINEAREYKLEAGSSVLDALNLIYDTWYLVGWTYAQVGGINVITIGGANVKSDANTISKYHIGIKQGITRIKATLSNAKDIVTRIYPFGSSQNMRARYYNGKDIHNAESVDIQHVMLPIDTWGKTDGLPDASKAYLENETASSYLGVRPKVIYLDGDEWGDIYPSIEGVTVGDVRAAKDLAGDTSYYPSDTIYPDDSERVDLVKGADPAPDNGTIGSGIASMSTAYWGLSGTAGKVYDVDKTISKFYIGDISEPVFTFSLKRGQYSSYGFKSTEIAELYTSNDLIRVSRAYLYVKDANGTASGIVKATITKTAKQTYGLSVDGKTLTHAQFGQDGDDGTNLTMVAWLRFDTVIDSPTDPDTSAVSSGTVTLNRSSQANRYITVDVKSGNAPTMKIRIKQIGFNMMDYTIGRNKGFIAFKTGDCAGRSFPINGCTYDADTDTWVLEIGRVVDSEVNMRFPNAIYDISEGDQFVLTDILLPDLYIGAAEQRLLKRAQEILDELSKPIFVIEPSLDSIFIEDKNALLRFKPGVYFDFDTEIFVEEYYSKLIDSVTIVENEAAIPVISITLREKKRKSFKKVSYSQSSGSSSNTQDADSGISEDTTVNPDSGETPSVTVDSALSDTSTNPVQNKVVKRALDAKADRTGLKKVATSGSYNDLTDKPTIPSAVTKTSQLTNDSGFLTEHQSLADYAKRSELPSVPSNVSAFNNDAGYLKSGSNISVLNNDAGYLRFHQSLVEYPKKKEIATINGQSLTEGGNIVIDGGGSSGSVNVMSKSAYDGLVRGGQIDEKKLYAVSALAPIVPNGMRLASGLHTTSSTSTTFDSLVNVVNITLSVDDIAAVRSAGGIRLTDTVSIDYEDGVWSMFGTPLNNASSFESMLADTSDMGGVNVNIQDQAYELENPVSGYVYFSSSITAGGDISGLFPSGQSGLRARDIYVNGASVTLYGNASGGGIIVSGAGEKVGTIADMATDGLSGEVQSATMYLGTKPLGGGDTSGIASQIDTINGEEI